MKSPIEVAFYLRGVPAVWHPRVQFVCSVFYSLVGLFAGKKQREQRDGNGVR